MKKTVQVLMLPTDNTDGSIIKSGFNTLFTREMNLKSSDTLQHLYLTSNEEIKDGEYFYNETFEMLFKNSYEPLKPSTIQPSEGIRKVIATTDKSLNLPLIPQSFIEEYVKRNADIKEVEYVVNKTTSGIDEIGIQVGNTIYYIQGKLAIEYLLPESKKQTLEEAAQEYEDNNGYGEILPIHIYDAFEAGAKWQQSNS